MKNFVDVQLLDATASILHYPDYLQYGCRSPTVSAFYASIRQIFHPDDGFTALKLR